MLFSDSSGHGVAWSQDVLHPCFRNAQTRLRQDIEGVEVWKWSVRIFPSGQMSLSWKGFMESLFVVWKSRAQHESEAVLPKSRMSALRRTAEDRRNLNDGRPAKRRDIRWSQMFRTAHSFWALSVDKRLWP